MEHNLAVQEEWREELVAGRLVAMGTPSTNHSHIVLNLSRIFGNFLHGKTCVPFGDNTKVFLTETDRYIPDAMIVCRPELIFPDGIHGAPDLVVEVLSPSTADQDKRRKKDVYEKCGVREYWIISPAEKAVEQYVLEEGRFVLTGVHTVYPPWMLEELPPEARDTVETEFSCAIFPELRLPLEDVLYRVL